MTILPATQSDIPLLAQMNHHLVEDMDAQNGSIDRYTARFHSWIGGGHWQVDLFDHDNSVVGYAVYQRRQDHFDRSLGVTFIRHFFIARNVRRSGLGTLAFNTLLETRFNRATTVTLDILPSTPDAHGFWQSLGFETYYTVLKR